tara:strand:+ start:219 stop:455 length:237 start_codon:yes stop_codon:yes gene_type:complete
VVVVLVEPQVHLLLVELVVHKEVMVMMDHLMDQDMVAAVVVVGTLDHSQTQKEMEHQTMEEVHSEVNFLQHSEILQVV